MNQINTEKISDMAWIAKLSDKEWEALKKRLPELLEITTREGIRMLKQMKSELE